MKIKSIKIKNFESHKDTTIDFSQGVNCIVGESDTGKSGILRALYWILLNDSSGDDFSSNRKTSGEIIVEHDNRIYSIIREKSSTKNQYQLIEDDKAPIIFKAIYSSVPEEIQQIFNISEVNIQEQGDMPFLLGSSPGDVGRRLNNIANLSIIDELQKRIKSKIIDTNNEYKNANEVLSHNKLELNKYSWLDNAEKDLDLLAQNNNIIEDIEKEIGILIYTIDKIKENKEELNLLKWIDTAFSEFDILLNYYNNYQTLSPSVFLIEDITISLINSNNEIEALSYIIDLNNDINELLEIYNNLSIIQKEFDNINSIYDSIFIIDKELDNIDNVLIFDKDLKEMERLSILATEIENEYKKLVEMINSINNVNNDIEIERQDINEIEAQFPDICPLCGNTFLIKRKTI